VSISYYYLIGTKEHGTKKQARCGWVWVGLLRIKGISNMNKQMPLGITIIYFDDQSKNIYAELPPDKEQAKRLSKRIYKDTMTALASREQSPHR